MEMRIRRKKLQSSADFFLIQGKTENLSTGKEEILITIKDQSFSLTHEVTVKAF